MVILGAIFATFIISLTIGGVIYLLLSKAFLGRWGNSSQVKEMQGDAVSRKLSYLSYKIPYGDISNSSQMKGMQGEAMVSETLSYLPEEYHVLNDIVLRTEKGTTQIDHVVVSKYGVFAIETKNYQGDIYGDDNHMEWTQLIVTDVTYVRKWYKEYTYVTKNRFYNPVKQALGHAYNIKSFLTDWPHLKIVPIVVFTGSANLCNVSSRNHVVYINSLLDTILNYRTIYLTETDVAKIIYLFSLKDVREYVDNRAHVLNIEFAKREIDEKISSGMCPKCGGTLVKRIGKYGFFSGCSNYPKCKFTVH